VVTLSKDTSVSSDSGLMTVKGDDSTPVVVSAVPSLQEGTGWEPMLVGGAGHGAGQRNFFARGW